MRKLSSPLVVASDEEAITLTAFFLHCGRVHSGDGWDTEEAWPDVSRRRLARRLLLRYRRTGRYPSEEERRLLATCCG